MLDGGPFQASQPTLRDGDDLVVRVQEWLDADGDEPAVVPLLEVDYETDLNLLNTAPPPRDRSGPAAVDLTVRHQPGAWDVGGNRIEQDIIRAWQLTAR